MLQRRYFHPNFDKQDTLNLHDSRKTKFLAFRLEPDKFLQLKTEASERNLDLSSLIRLKLEGKNE